MPPGAKTIAVILAGGQGKRIGGDKATVELDGRPLIDYPLSVLRALVDEVAVVAKRDTALPQLPADVHVWVEPDEPRHPLTGIVHALRLAGGRPVFVCAADMVLLDEDTARTIVEADRAHPPIGVVPEVEGRLEPLCAIYEPLALDGLARFEPGVRAADAVRELGVRVLPLPDATPFFNVNAPEDVLQAAVLLHRRRPTI